MWHTYMTQHHLLQELSNCASRHARCHVHICTRQYSSARTNNACMYVCMGWKRRTITSRALCAYKLQRTLFSSNCWISVSSRRFSVVSVRTRVLRQVVTKSYLCLGHHNSHNNKEQLQRRRRDVESRSKAFGTLPSFHHLLVVGATEHFDCCAWRGLVHSG